MSKRRKPKIEFRYYKMPPGSPILALLGEKWYQEYGKDIDTLHFHNYLEIGYCYGGKGTMVLGEQEHRFGEGSFTVIPKNFPHTTNSDPGTLSKWEYLFVDVEGLLQNLGQGGRQRRMIQKIQSGALLLTREEFPKLADVILDVLDTMRETREYYLEEAKGGVIVILAEAARKNENGGVDLEEPGRDTTIPIARAMDYITHHYMEPLKIEQLADFCHISETHFRRMFSAYMNMSPLEYINQVRIKIACDYLRKTEEPISGIAHKCGFVTPSTFNRNFRQVMGVTPREWRKLPSHYEQQLLKFEVHSEEGW